MRLGSASSDGQLYSNTSMNDVPPPCDDGSDSDVTEKEQHNAWQPYAGTLHAVRHSPKVQQCLKEEEQCRTALTCHFALTLLLGPRSGEQQVAAGVRKHLRIWSVCVRAPALRRGFDAWPGRSRFTLIVAASMLFLRGKEMACGEAGEPASEVLVWLPRLMV